MGTSKHEDNEQGVLVYLAGVGKLDIVRAICADDQECVNTRNRPMLDGLHRSVKNGPPKHLTRDHRVAGRQA